MKCMRFNNANLCSEAEEARRGEFLADAQITIAVASASELFTTTYKKLISLDKNSMKYGL